MSETKKVTRVLVVDDSAFMRQLITTILKSDPGIEVVGTAPDPLIAREKIKTLNPDVLTLDIEMPHMDGIEFLRRLMSLRPTRVLMISTLTKKNADASLHALALGAIDCLEKPINQLDGTLTLFKAELLEKIRMVAAAQLGTFRPVPRHAPARRTPSRTSGAGFIALGASTGGVEALNYLLHELPTGLPPIAIVQHMPPRFTASFAQRLDGICALDVREAENGMDILPNQIVIAPGGLQLEIRRKGDRYQCNVFEGPQVSGHAPSVDVMFSSVAKAVGPDAIGVILTGMGQDGARGLLEMRQAGARTFGQDRQSSLVYGMPRVAAETGAVEAQLSLDRIADALVGAADALKAPMPAALGA